MKRNALSLAVMLGLALIALGLSGCQPAAAPDTNRAANTSANTNAANQVVDTAGIEAELTSIENDYPRVLKEKDATAVERVEADDLVIIFPDGSLGSKAQDVIDIREGNMTADSWEVADLTVKVLDNDAAFVSGRSIIKGGKIKTPEGKTVDISGQYRFIDTFARRNGQWKLVGSVTTPIKNPVAAAAASPATKASPTVSPLSKASPATKASPTMAPTSKASPTIKASPAVPKATP